MVDFYANRGGRRACGYALAYGFISKRREFLKELLPVAARSMNLTAVVFFLVGSVGVFQFVAANMAWPQDLAEMVIEMNLSHTISLQLSCSSDSLRNVLGWDCNDPSDCACDLSCF
ncbi:MAG: hypothetical protein CM15mP62_29570 [Rhodospirillaceae bacterium]|nr:MAG: hypothetical protein CM15mP62_29570 [Rhodospirillaceae bacterium]